MVDPRRLAQARHGALVLLASLAACRQPDAPPASVASNDASATRGAGAAGTPSPTEKAPAEKPPESSATEKPATEKPATEKATDKPPAAVTADTPPATPPPTTAPPTDAIASLTIAAPVEGTWREVQTLADAAEFVADSGVLVRNGKQYLEQGPAGSLRPVRGLASGLFRPQPKRRPTPDDDEEGAGDLEMGVEAEGIRGRWPTNAWHVKELSDGRRGLALELRRWDGQRWRNPNLAVPGAGDDVLFAAEGNTLSAVESYFVMGWSERGGMLVGGMRETGDGPITDGVRLLGESTAPMSVTIAGDLVTWTETRSGSLFALGSTEMKGWARRLCPEPAPAGCKPIEAQLGAVDHLRALPSGEDRVIVTFDTGSEGGPGMLAQFDGSAWRVGQLPKEYRADDVAPSDDGVAWLALRPILPKDPWKIARVGAEGELAMAPTPSLAPTDIGVRLAADGRPWVIATDGGKTRLYEWVPASAVPAGGP